MQHAGAVGRPPQAAGYGRGFSAIEERIVFSDLRNPLIHDDSHLDESLTFYREDWTQSYAASSDALAALRAAGRIDGSMVRGVFHLTEHGVQPTIWHLVDFPTFDIIDYATSSVRWRIYSPHESAHATETSFFQI
jgi:hypothetical protein